MKPIDTNPFLVKPGTKVRLHKWPTESKPVYRSKEHYEELLADHIERLGDLQSRLYASNRYAVLVILQAMDAAGKDGAIKHVMSGVNPQGVQVFSFKHPSVVELDHDFLWRTAVCLPERGRIGMFNRSYYEEVLAVRVHPEFLAAQNLPSEVASHDRLWERRFKSILDFEAHLHRNGTRTVKLFLHLSKDEQRKRLLERIDDPDKNWKFSAGDLGERTLWKQYMHAYEQCLTATSTHHAPWYVVPADDKPNARLIVSQAILQTLEAINPKYPSLTSASRRGLRRLRRSLQK